MMTKSGKVNDLSAAAAVPPVRIRLAGSVAELAQAQRLRRAVFCVEQGLFAVDDRDAYDAIASTIVAVADRPGADQTVIGTARIHCAGDGLWWGSRLAVHPDFRRRGYVGSSLIRMVVSAALAFGARSVRAHAQAQQRAMFERLHWRVLAREQLWGRSHLLMEALLSAYAACPDPRAGFTAGEEESP